MIYQTIAILQTNNTFNPLKELRLSANETYPLFQPTPEWKSDKLVRKLFCIVEASHFIFNNCTRTMLPGYHLHFVLWAKNVSADRNFRGAQHLNLYNQISITTLRGFYQNDIFFPNHRCKHCMNLLKIWVKKLHLEERTWVTSTWRENK